jgi:GxxExxY protein
MNTTYAMCIGKEFSLRGIDYADEVSVPVDYKGTRFRAGYSIDFVVRRRLAVMVKCVERLLPVHSAQLITYLRLANLETGLLVNFNVPSLRQGLRRHTVQFEPPY